MKRPAGSVEKARSAGFQPAALRLTGQIKAPRGTITILFVVFNYFFNTPPGVFSCPESPRGGGDIVKTQ